jgi:hypothetical protein
MAKQGLESDRPGSQIPNNRRRDWRVPQYGVRYVPVLRDRLGPSSLSVQRQGPRVDFRLDLEGLGGHLAFVVYGLERVLTIAPATNTSFYVLTGPSIDHFRRAPQKNQW